jgi:hypothetical protein
MIFDAHDDPGVQDGQAAEGNGMHADLTNTYNALKKIYRAHIRPLEVCLTKLGVVNFATRFAYQRACNTHIHMCYEGMYCQDVHTTNISYILVFPCLMWETLMVHSRTTISSTSSRRSLPTRTSRQSHSSCLLANIQSERPPSSTIFSVCGYKPCFGTACCFRSQTVRDDWLSSQQHQCGQCAQYL